MKFKRQSRKDRGVALLIAISFLLVMTFLVMEVARETVIEYSMAARKVHKIKSYYAAKAGMRLALLRLNLYTDVLKNVMKNFSSQMNSERLEVINEIWRFPLNWPLSQSLPEEIPTQLKKKIKDVEKKSFLKANFAVTIIPQGTLIDINNLGSASSNLSKATKILILSIFNEALEKDKDFAEKYRYFDFKKLVNNIIDWVDYDKVSLNGSGSESADYELDPRLHNKDFMPPNQPFKTFLELHMVKDMKDDFYNLLIPHLTLYGDMGFNINQPENIERLSKYKIFKEDILQAFSERFNLATEGENALFTSKKNLLEFLNEQGLSPDMGISEGMEEGDEDFMALKDFPFSFGFENFFRILSHSEEKGVSSDIIVHTSDLKLNEKSLESHLESEDEPIEEESSSTPTNTQGTTPSNEGRGGSSPPLPESPTIVYWKEI